MGVRYVATLGPTGYAKKYVSRIFELRAYLSPIGLKIQTRTTLHI